MLPTFQHAIKAREIRNDTKSLLLLDSALLISSYSTRCFVYSVTCFSNTLTDTVEKRSTCCMFFVSTCLDVLYLENQIDLTIIFSQMLYDVIILCNFVV